MDVLQGLRLEWGKRLLVTTNSLLMVKSLQWTYESYIRVHNLFVAFKELLTRQW